MLAVARGFNRREIVIAIYPVCVKGKRATPPEDVGGILGYAQYQEAMANPNHPEHEMYLEWHGEFDPEAFDLEEVNEALRALR